MMTPSLSNTGNPEIKDSKLDKVRYKILLKESVRNALSVGLINDESLAYIRALGYAHQDNPSDPRVNEAICKILHSILKIYNSLEKRPFSTEERRYNERLAREKLNEGLLENFGNYSDEHLLTSIPSRIISYLEEQRILLMPLDIGTSTIVEAGKLRNFHYLQEGQRHTRQMSALNKHWIGLFFRTETKMVEKGKVEMKKSYNPANPVTIDNTTFVFVDDNLKGTNIDLFYPSLIYQLNALRSKGYAKFLHLNLIFKNCWVKNMDLRFWRYVSNFPGVITVVFEACDDFDEACFPYLTKEFEGKHYYLDLDKFSRESKHLKNESYMQSINNTLRVSRHYRYEHLR